MRCEDCETMAECRHAFGDFWNDKSGGGEGCSVPFRPPDGWLDGVDGAERRRTFNGVEITVRSKARNGRSVRCVDAISRLDKLKAMAKGK